MNVVNSTPMTTQLSDDHSLTTDKSFLMENLTLKKFFNVSIPIEKKFNLEGTVILIGDLELELKDIYP